MKNIFGDISRRLSHGPIGPREISQPQGGWKPGGINASVLKGQRNRSIGKLFTPFPLSLRDELHVVTVFQPLCGWLISVVASRLRFVDDFVLRFLPCVFALLRLCVNFHV